MTRGNGVEHGVLCEGVLGAGADPHSLLCGGSQVSSEIFDDIASSNTFYAQHCQPDANHSGPFNFSSFNILLSIDNLDESNDTVNDQE